MTVPQRLIPFAILCFLAAGSTACGSGTVGLLNAGGSSSSSRVGVGQIELTDTKIGSP